MSDWKETCAKCMDGDIEPRQCEYYGEPNGCNSPSYGEHPTTEKSSAVGNAAAMREALVQCELFLGNVSRHGHPTLNPGDNCTACDGVDELREMVVRALAAPPRNCDVGTPQEQEASWKDYCDDVTRGDCPPSAGCKSCALYWAQMPYAAKEGAGK